MVLKVDLFHLVRRVLGRMDLLYLARRVPGRMVLKVDLRSLARRVLGRKVLKVDLFHLIRRVLGRKVLLYLARRVQGLVVFKVDRFHLVRRVLGRVDLKVDLFHLVRRVLGWVDLRSLARRVPGRMVLKVDLRSLVRRVLGRKVLLYLARRVQGLVVLKVDLFHLVRRVLLGLVVLKVDLFHLVRRVLLGRMVLKVDLFHLVRRVLGRVDLLYLARMVPSRMVLKADLFHLVRRVLGRVDLLYLARMVPGRMVLKADLFHLARRVLGHMVLKVELLYLARRVQGRKGSPIGMIQEQECGTKGMQGLFLPDNIPTRALGFRAKTTLNDMRQGESTLAIIKGIKGVSMMMRHRTKMPLKLLGLHNRIQRSHLIVPSLSHQSETHGTTVREVDHQIQNDESLRHKVLPINVIVLLTYRIPTPTPEGLHLMNLVVVTVAADEVEDIGEEEVVDDSILEVALIREDSIGATMIISETAQDHAKVRCIVRWRMAGSPTPMTTEIRNNLGLLGTSINKTVITDLINSRIFHRLLLLSTQGTMATKNQMKEGRTKNRYRNKKKKLQSQGRYHHLLL
jgi:hypothetical protein